MTRNEGQTAKPDNQDQYEATVLDFLDKEMAAVQPVEKKKDESAELDALVSDLLKQVISEADQPRNSSKPLFDEEDELFTGLIAQKTEQAPAPSVDVAGKQVSEPPPPAAAAAPAPAVQVEEVPEKTEPASNVQPVKPAAAPIFGSAPKPAKKPPVAAIAFALLAVVVGGSAVYHFSRSTGNGSKEPGTQPAVTENTKPAPAVIPAAAPPTAATAAATPVVQPKRETPAAPVKTNPPAPPAAATQKQPPAAQPATAQQNAKPAPAKSTAPATVAAATAPAKEEKPVATPTPVTPTPVPAAPPVVTTVAVEKPAAPPVAEAVPVTTAVPEKKPAPAAPPVSVSTENSSPAPQPAAAPPIMSRNLIPAAPTAQATPIYPELALRARASGSVVLDLQIDEQGKVTKATPASGPTIFYKAAIDAAMKWRYKPASIGGVSVRSQSRVTMDFNLKK